MSAVWRAQRAAGSIAPFLVHTGQHRDAAMSESFFADLELPEPDVHLSCAGGTQAEQIGRMLGALDPVLADLRADLVVVVGDVNSTAAGALAAGMRQIPVAHVEAGLRSFDRAMPEELNRILVDRISDHLFASEQSGVDNLVSEGRSDAVVHHVGNVMIDTLVRFRSRRSKRDPRQPHGIEGPYALLTLHRPSNVDRGVDLEPLLRTLGAVSRRLPIIFPVHPRTRLRLRSSGLERVLADFPGIRPVDPVGYLEMLALLENAAVVLTDSGGVQEETTFLGVPCLTLRERTERPATVTEGTNRVIGTEPERVTQEIERVLEGDRPAVRCPALWDGRAAERLMDILVDRIR